MDKKCNRTEVGKRVKFLEKYAPNQWLSMSVDEILALAQSWLEKDKELKEAEEKHVRDYNFQYEQAKELEECRKLLESFEDECLQLLHPEYRTKHINKIEEALQLLCEQARQLLEKGEP